MKPTTFCKIFLILELCFFMFIKPVFAEDKIPLDQQVISTCEEFKLDSTTIALSGGEDYELLFTVSMEDFPKIKANPNLSIIGHITNEKEGIHLITRGNEKIPLIARGWNSLDSNQE